MKCECCGDYELSDDPEIASEGLCDRCNREINEDSQIIGWGKGEQYQYGTVPVSMRCRFNAETELKMYWIWILEMFDTMPLGERWSEVNDLTCQLVTLAHGGPF